MMPRVLDQPVQFRAGALTPELRTRSEPGRPPSRVARRDLDRYYQMLKRALPTFSEAEASLIVETLNGRLIAPHSAGLLWAEVEGAITVDGLDRKWDLDGQALVKRIRALTPFEQLAIADAAERFWTGPYLRTDLATRLREVGLVRTGAHEQVAVPARRRDEEAGDGQP